MEEKSIQELIQVKGNLYTHQKQAAQFALKHFGVIENSNNFISNGVAYLMEMGTGKTLASIAVVSAMLKKGLIKRILIVAPLSILSVWKEEFEKFADFDYDLTILKGTNEKKKEQLKSLNDDTVQIVVINYESMWRLEKELSIFNPDLIIADEAHRIKTHNIAASKAMHRLGLNTKYKLLLTGTLITNKEIDVFSPFKFLNPNIFGKSFYIFRNRYFNMTGYGNYTPVLKKSMKQELANKTHKVSFRATKKECLDLPEKAEIVRHIELEDKAKTAYKKLVKECYLEIGQTEITATNVLTKLLRLSQLTGGFLGDDSSKKTQNISKAKLQALEDIINDSLNEDKKIVVIARFIPEIKAIEKMIKDKKIKYSIITGDVKNREE